MTQRYMWSYRFEEDDGEMVLHIDKLDGIVSRLGMSDYRKRSKVALQDYVTGAVIIELQAIIATKAPVPDGDDGQRPQDTGLIALTLQQSVKLELYKLYRSEYRSVADFARNLDKRETLVRRMLDLRHRSSVAEIEEAIESLGRRLVVTWHTELVGPTKHTARPPAVAA